MVIAPHQRCTFGGNLSLTWQSPEPKGDDPALDTAAINPRVTIRKNRVKEIVPRQEEMLPWLGSAVFSRGTVLLLRKIDPAFERNLSGSRIEREQTAAVRLLVQASGSSNDYSY